MYGAVSHSSGNADGDRRPLVATMDCEASQEYRDDHDDGNTYLFGPLVRTLSEAGQPLIRTVSEGVHTLANADFTLSDSAADICEDRIHHMVGSGKATIPSEIANMTKNLIGGGVLSLSGGIALFSNDPSMYTCFSAIFWVILMGTIFGYFSLLIAKSCELSLSATYRECWERTVGHRGGMLVAIVNTLDPLLGILANASILSQSLQLMLLSVNVNLNLTECLLLVTVVGLLPLCLLKNLAALAPFSALGMVAVLCALGCMMIRYWDGSYQPDGQFYDEIPTHLRPSFGYTSRPWSVYALPFVCMIFTSFDMHYNIPRFYAELREASIPRFGQVVGYSFGITAVIYFSIAIVGFLTFGENADSYILNNYSSKDSLATLSRLAIGLCSLVSYPLNFIGVRDNCLDLLGLTDAMGTGGLLNVFTLLLLFLLTLISCFVTDLGLINAVGGGTTVTLVCFVFPAVMFWQGKRQHHAVNGGTMVGKNQMETCWVMMLMVVGVVVGVVGVWSSIVFDA